MAIEELLLKLIIEADLNGLKLQGIVIPPRKFKELKESIGNKVEFTNTGCIRIFHNRKPVEIIQAIYD